MSQENGGVSEVLARGAIVAGILVTAWAYSEWSTWFPANSNGLRASDVSGLATATNSAEGQNSSQSGSESGSLTPIPTTDFARQQTVTDDRGNVFRIIPDPFNGGRECVELDLSTNGNWQDIYRAGMVLGPDPTTYNEIPGPVVVYKPNLEIIGSFMTDKLPDESTFGVVYPGTKACNSSPNSTPVSLNQRSPSGIFNKI